MKPRPAARASSPSSGGYPEPIHRVVDAHPGRVVDAHPGRDIIIVAHGGTICAALALALGLDPEASLTFTIENCSITRIDRIDGPGRARAGVS